MASGLPLDCEVDENGCYLSTVGHGLANLSIFGKLLLFFTVGHGFIIFFIFGKILLVHSGPGHDKSFNLGNYILVLTQLTNVLQIYVYIFTKFIPEWP